VCKYSPAVLEQHLFSHSDNFFDQQQNSVKHSKFFIVLERISHLFFEQQIGTVKETGTEAEKETNKKGKYK
jgi:hypothetical protein